MGIFIEDAPSGESPRLSSYLRRMFTRIDSALDSDVTPRVWSKLPPKPSLYTIVAFKAAIPNTTIDAPGLYYFDGTNWQHL